MKRGKICFYLVCSVGGSLLAVNVIYMDGRQMQALLGPNGDFFSVTLLLPQTANTPVAYSLANLS